MSPHASPHYLPRLAEHVLSLIGPPAACDFRSLELLGITTAALAAIARRAREKPPCPNCPDCPARQDRREP